jgi:quinol monooxygenase YgiN
MSTTVDSLPGSPLVRWAELDVELAMMSRFEVAALELRDAVMNTEPGVVAYHAVAEASVPGRIHVLEIYDDADAYRAHAKSAHFIAFRTATDGLVVQRRIHDLVAVCFASKGELPTSPLARIGELEVDRARLRSYEAHVSAEITESVRVEPGVLTLYAAQFPTDPSRLRFFEIYADESAYQSHLQSPHFGHYAQATQSMIQGKRLVATRPLFLSLRTA